jgi:hypothetical protein
MNRTPEINIFGAGQVARQAVAQAARRHRDVRFRLFSRNPQRYLPPAFRNVELCELDDLLPGHTPLVLCLASDERRIIQGCRGHSTGTIPRSAVAASNLRLLREVIDAQRWRNRLVIVVTNPVELVCEFLVRLTGNRHVYGFGLASDCQRVREAICQGFRISRDLALSVPVTGLHCLGPIPLLSQTPDLLKKVGSVSAENVVSNFAGGRPLHGARPGALAGNIWSALTALPGPPSAQTLVGAIVNGITASEFRGSAPPVRRGAANLAQLLSTLIRRGTVPVSGLVRDGRLLGGMLNVSDGSFQVPDPGPGEREILENDLVRFDELRRQHLG